MPMPMPLLYSSHDGTEWWWLGASCKSMQLQDCFHLLIAEWPLCCFRWPWKAAGWANGMQSVPRQHRICATGNFLGRLSLQEGVLLPSLWWHTNVWHARLCLFGVQLRRLHIDAWHYLAKAHGVLFSGVGSTSLNGCQKMLPCSEHPAHFPESRAWHSLT